MMEAHRFELVILSLSDPPMATGKSGTATGRVVSEALTAAGIKHTLTWRELAMTWVDA